MSIDDLEDDDSGTGLGSGNGGGGSSPSKPTKPGRRRVGDKIRVLRREGEPEKQAVATALNMERSGRLREGGRYIHVSRSRSRGRKFTR